MQMPRVEIDWKLSPQFFMSAANFCAILVGIIWAYAGLTSDVKADKMTIQNLQGEIAKLQAKDENTFELIRQIQMTFGTRLVKLESDTAYIKEGVARIEQRQASPQRN